MDLELGDKNVVITGGSRGIGKAAARRFLAEGANVHIVSSSSSNVDGALAELDAAAKAARDSGPAITGTASGSAADLSDPVERERLVDRLGRVDILVNNAGAVPQGAIELARRDDVLAAWELKVFGYLELSRLWYEHMAEAGSGVILNVIGISGWRPRADYIAGSMANASLTALTLALGSVSLDRGVRVVGINPGHTLTDRQLVRWRALAEERFGDADQWEQLATDLPGGRLARPEEVADTLVFLASARSSYTSGVVVDVDGGISQRTAAPWRQ